MEAVVIDRTRLSKLMNLTTSDSDGEALNALRKANELLTKHKLTWSEILLKAGAATDNGFSQRARGSTARGYDPKKEEEVKRQQEWAERAKQQKEQQAEAQREHDRKWQDKKAKEAEAEFFGYKKRQDDFDKQDPNGRIKGGRLWAQTGEASKLEIDIMLAFSEKHVNQDGISFIQSLKRYWMLNEFLSPSQIKALKKFYIRSGGNTE